MGAVVGDEDFKTEYCQKITNKWNQEMAIPSEIALTQPQSAYACFVSGYQHTSTSYAQANVFPENYSGDLRNALEPPSYQNVYNRRS